MLTTLRLHQLKNAEDIAQIEIPENAGSWVTGFGWDQNLWQTKNFPSRELLDQAFGDRKVVLFRADGHALWVSSAVLRHIGWAQSDGTFNAPESPTGGEVLLDKQGQPTGVLIDQAMAFVKPHLPTPSPEDIGRDLMRATRYFNSKGFTHIRDMSCSEQQWHQARILEDSGQLTLFVDQLFDTMDPEGFDQAMKLALAARKDKSRLLRPQGLKVFYDGALGSNGALLSKPYKETGKSGLRILSEPQLAEFIRRSWDEDFDIAVHCIGDQASFEVLRVANKLFDQGLRGRLHLEHAQLLSDESLKLISKLDVVCHMQPCHFLSDRRWLRDKLGDLYPRLFRWADLEKQGSPVFFGSDEPIEPTGVLVNQQAVVQAAQEGLPSPKKPVVQFQSYPIDDDCRTQFDDQGQVTKMDFLGQGLVIDASV